MPTRPVRRLAFLASVILAAALVAPSRAQEKKKDPAEVMKSLEQMVKDYQDENATLKARVKELEGQVEHLKQNRVVNVLPTQPAVPGQMPPTWKPFQFNGATYYLVPLAGAGAADSAAIKTLATAPPANAKPTTVTTGEHVAPQK
jgi:hypothetical protein